MKRMGLWKRRLFDCFFPLTCAACRMPLAVGSEIPLCDGCRVLWEQAKATPCAVCTRPAALCRCVPMGLSPSVDAFCHLTPYQAGVGRQVVLEGKERMHPRLATFLAQELARTLPPLPKHTVIAYVPRRRKAKCQKGYDQAERLAKALGKICGIRVVEALCRTTSEAKEQKQLNRAQRWKASQNAYGAGQEIEAVANAFVLLVDDVLTSGATLSGCGTILKENGADAICALTIAYTNENQKNRKDEET